jgi:hypothetical protein
MARRLPQRGGSHGFGDEYRRYREQVGMLLPGRRS